MSRRRLIMLMALFLYVLEVGTIFGLRHLDPSEATGVGIAHDVVQIVAYAIINYAIMRYLLVALTHDEEAYANDLNEQLNRLLASYRTAARKEEEIVGQLGSELSAELSLARDALSRHSVDQLGEHLQTGLAIASKAPTPLCDNAAVAAVLETKARACASAGILFEAHVALPEEMAIPDVEIASLFFNLIDNAIHACEELIGTGETMPLIQVHARIQAEQLFIEVANPSAEPVDVWRASALRRDGTVLHHGLGTHIVSTIVSWHHGIVEYSQGEGRFVAAIMIPLSA